MYTLYKPTTLDYTKLVSIVYAVVLASLGIVFPIAEALKDQWLETLYHTVFLTFTLTLSSIFLIYLLFFILRPVRACKSRQEYSKQFSKFTSDTVRWKSKAQKKKPAKINEDEKEENKSELLDIPQMIVSPSDNLINGYKHRYARRKSNVSFSSFSGLEFGVRKSQHKSTDDISVASFHKSSKLLNLRGVDPAEDVMYPLNKRQKRSNYSLFANQVAFGKDAGKEKWQSENEEDLKAESDDDEEEVNESQAWINTDSFGNVFTHQGSNLFLRLGALIFGLGNLVNYALKIQANLMTNVECSHKMRFGWIFIWMFIFVFLQTFLLFKHAKIKVTRHQPLVWFGMVHLILTNINLWLHTLISEIIDEHHYNTMLKLHRKNSTTFNGALNEKCDMDLLNEASKYLTPFVLEYSLVAVGSISCFIYFGAIESGSSFVKTNRNIIKVFSVTPSDLEQYVEQINNEEAKTSRSGSKVKFSENVHKHTSILSKKLEKVNENTVISSQQSSLKHSPVAAATPLATTTQADPHAEENSMQKSHMGLFLGMVILCVSIVTAVVFLFSQLQHNRPRAEVIYFCTDIVIHFLLLIACLCAFVLTRNLAFAPKPVTIDDILILLAAFGSITYEVVNASALLTTRRSHFGPPLDLVSHPMPIYSDSNSTSFLRNDTSSTFHPFFNDTFKFTSFDPFHLIRNKLQLASACFGMIQTTVQTMLIFVSLRRYPATITEATDMPGRGTMGFLIVGNISVWVLRSILCKNLQMPVQAHFYGEMGSLLLTDINFPLLLFFRFHSSVCLVDIWKSAYQLLTQNNPCNNPV